MKLDRNVNPNGRGKYALIKLRDATLRRGPVNDEKEASLIVNESAVDCGDTPDTEFFVLRLKDKYAPLALMGYIQALSLETEPDTEYIEEIRGLLRKAQNHPNQRKPD